MTLTGKALGSLLGTVIGTVLVKLLGTVVLVGIEFGIDIGTVLWTVLGIATWLLPALSNILYIVCKALLISVSLFSLKVVWIEWFWPWIWSVILKILPA